MESHLSHFLRHNDSPDEETIQEVRNLLSTPRHKLDEIKAEIQHHERALEALKSQYIEVQQSTEGYNAIISPMRRLPEDILLAIFFHCLPILHNPIMDESEAPILLTHICGSWRSLVLSSPRMWARIHIAFSDEDQVPEILPLGSYSDGNSDAKLAARRIMQTRCDRVNDWLSLSGACSLSISINYESKMWYSPNGSDPDESQHSTAKLFGILAPSAQRWKHIEINGMPYRVYLGLENLVSKSAQILPMLKTMKVSLTHMEHEDYIVHHQSALKLLNASSLKSISVKMPTIWTFSLPPPPRSWMGITYLSVHSPNSTSDLFFMLQFCPNLIHCKFFVDDFSEPSDISIEGVANLEHLKTLVIYEEVTHAKASKFYSSINAPNLRWIHYQRFIYNPLELEDVSIQSPIFYLLQRSHKLKKLTIEPTAFSKANFRNMLQVIPGITHLCVGKEISVFPVHDSNSSIPRLPRIPGRYTIGQERFDINILMADSNSTDNFGTPATNNNRVLLPNLEVFELTENGSAQIPSDEILKQFITNRLELDSTKGATAFRHVRIVFGREQMVDIREEVSRSAKLAGVDFTLELDYLPPSASKERVPPSPSCGVQDSTGRTWTYTEIEENYL